MLPRPGFNKPDAYLQPDDHLPLFGDCRPKLNDQCLNGCTRMSSLTRRCNETDPPRYARERLRSAYPRLRIVLPPRHVSDKGEKELVI